MSSLTSAYPLVPDPAGPDEVDPGVVALALTAMYLTVFFSLLGMGYPGEQALALTISLGLGSITVLDRFGHYVSRRRPPRGQR